MRRANGARTDVPKRILATGILGQRGINLIEGVVLKMGFVWYSTGGLEAGVDGFIEIREPHTGVVTNSVLQVQSRATSSRFTAETDSSFEYVCEQRDLDYWLSGNVPLILVVSRPEAQEAYWVSIKDYFKDPAVRRGRRIVFDKGADRFTPDCAARLAAIAASRDSGLYFEPPPAAETLYSNLLSVEYVTPSLWVANTPYRSAGQIYTDAKRFDVRLTSEWFLHDANIFSFHDLNEPPWNRFCEGGTAESFDVSEWENSDDPERRKQFVRLLNCALREKAYQLSMLYSRDLDLYYFRATRGLRTRTVTYHRLAKGRRTVFKQYRKKTDPKQIGYYRHSAFEGRFLSVDAKWFLEITPTYYYTTDGHAIHPYHEEYLSGIKRLERNSAVLGQVMLFADHLTRPPDMYTTEYPFLKFGALATFDVGVGINDRLWLPAEEEQVSPGLHLADDNVPSFNDED